jgi:LysW-gamma-L-lysine carboxypeptidase
MSLLFAFEDFVKTEGGKDRLIFAAVVNEEGDSSGLNQLIRDKIKADYAIFGEPGGLDKITVGYRGHIPLKLEVETPEVHSSAPWLSTNSAEIAMRTYEELKRALGAQGTSEETVRKVSVALTQISAGRAHNVTPGLTTASIDIRLPLGTTTAQVMSKVEEVISSFRQSVEGKKARILATFGEPTEPYSAKISSPLVRALSRSIIKGSANKPTLISKSGTGDMNTYALSFGSQCVTYGPGDAKLSHTSGEFVDANEVISCSRVLVAAIEELVASSPK